MLPAMITHDGLTHEKDGESFTDIIRDVLRNGAELPWSD
jgi:hypothetical protein